MFGRVEECLFNFHCSCTSVATLIVHCAICLKFSQTSHFVNSLDNCYSVTGLHKRRIVLSHILYMASCFLQSRGITLEGSDYSQLSTFDF
jgi:hypothetical protein